MNFELVLQSGVKAKSTDRLYKGSYTFNRVSYDVDIYEDRVRVLREAGSNGFNISRRNAEDAIRKAYILYSLQTGRGLDIKKYRFGKMSDKKLTDKDLEIYDEAAELPFVVSMLKDSMLIHDGQECDGSGIFRNEKIMKAVAGSKRSDYQSDKSMIALFAYLIGRSREYEMDRFINQWTAINAIYDGFIEAYGSVLRNAIKSLMEKLPENERLSDQRIEELIDLPKSDNQKVQFFSRYMQSKKQIRSGKTSSKPDRDRELGVIDNTWQDDFKHFISAKKFDGGKRVFYDFSELESVCLDAGWEGYDWGDQEKQEAYEKLRDRANGSGSALYAFLTFDLPYHIRNDYIHGSMAALIFSDVYNVNKLATANYFMDRLITEMLPIMFDGGKMYQELLQIHDHYFARLIRKLKNDQNCKVKNAQDKAQKAKQSLADLQKIKEQITAENRSLAWLRKSI